MTSAPTSSRPALLTVAWLLVLLEVLTLGVAAGAGVVSLARGAHVGPVVFLVLLALGAATLLAAAARALRDGRRWGRGPVLTAQILTVVVAGTWWGAGGGPLALAPIVVALVVAVALLTPAVVAATSATGAVRD